MKDWHNLQGAAQSEALLNELKGNLFEYLVAHQLSVHFGGEGDFLRRFKEMSGGRAYADLKDYQSWLRSVDPDLYSRLPVLAKDVANHLIDGDFANAHKSVKTKDFKVHHINVLGKSGAVSGQESFKEADILLETNQGDVPVSLKLCKTGAFVNTKSGGIRSFIEKYFSHFPKAKEYQSELNDFLEQSFTQMAEGLYQWADIDSSDEMIDSGVHGKQFSRAWVERGYSELPGELESEARTFLFHHYHRVIGRMHVIFKELIEQDRELFGLGLAPLVGMGLEQMIQVTCFHKEVKGERYHLASLKSYSWADFQEDLKSLELRELQEEISSFEIGLGARRLQIRVKPMNKFTVCALKVNCSLKGE